MPSHTFGTIEGEIKILTIDSESIRGNMLGDPRHRQVQI